MMGLSFGRLGLGQRGGLGQALGAVASFGALTLQNAGAAPAPSGATSISNDGGTGLVLSGGALVAGAAGVSSGTVTFDNGSTLAVEATPLTYTVTNATELVAAMQHTGLAFGHVIEVASDATLGSYASPITVSRTAAIAGTYAADNQPVVQPRAGRTPTIARMTITGTPGTLDGAFRIKGWVNALSPYTEGDSNGRTTAYFRADGCDRIAIEDCAWVAPGTPDPVMADSNYFSGYILDNCDDAEVSRVWVDSCVHGGKIANCARVKETGVVVSRCWKDSFAPENSVTGWMAGWMASVDHSTHVEDAAILGIHSLNPLTIDVSQADYESWDRLDDPHLLLKTLNRTAGGVHALQGAYTKLSAGDWTSFGRVTDGATYWRLVFHGFDVSGIAGANDAIDTATAILRMKNEHTDHTQSFGSARDYSGVVLHDLLFVGGRVLEPQYYGGQGIGSGGGATPDGSARIDGAIYYDIAGFGFVAREDYGFVRDFSLVRAWGGPLNITGAAITGNGGLEVRGADVVVVAPYTHQSSVTLGGVNQKPTILNAALSRPVAPDGAATAPASYLADFADPPAHNAPVIETYAATRSAVEAMWDRIALLHARFAPKAGGARAAQPGVSARWTARQAGWDALAAGTIPVYAPPDGPAQIAGASWSGADDGAAGVTVTVSTPPDAGDGSILGYQVRADAGAPVNGLALALLGAGAHAVQVRAYTEHDVGPWSVAKTVTVADSYIPAFVASGTSGYIDLSSAITANANAMTLRVRLASALSSAAILFQAAGRTSIQVNTDGSINVRLSNAESPTTVWNGTTAPGVVAASATAAGASDIDITASVSAPGAVPVVVIRVNGVDVTPTPTISAACASGQIELTRTGMAMLATATFGTKANSILADLLLDFTVRAATEFRTSSGKPVDPRDFAAPFLLVGGPVTAGVAAESGTKTGAVVQGATWTDA